jgi:hypothetical protein
VSSVNQATASNRKIEIEKVIGSPEIKEKLAKNSIDTSKAMSKPINIGNFSIDHGADKENDTSNVYKNPRYGQKSQNLENPYRRPSAYSRSEISQNIPPKAKELGNTRETLAMSSSNINILKFKTQNVPQDVEKRVENIQKTVQKEIRNVPQVSQANNPSSTY